MRRTRDILMILLAAVCVVSGALLPQVAAGLQDHQLRQSGEIRTLDTVQLLLRQELSPVQTLALLSGTYTKISWDSGTRLTRQEAESYMSGALWDLIQIGLTSDIALEEKLVLWSEFLLNCCGIYSSGEKIIGSVEGQSTVKLTLSSIDDTQDACTASLTINGADFSFVI